MKQIRERATITLQFQNCNWDLLWDVYNCGSSFETRHEIMEGVEICHQSESVLLLSWADLYNKTYCNFIVSICCLAGFLTNLLYHYVHGLLYFDLQTIPIKVINFINIVSQRLLRLIGRSVPLKCIYMSSNETHLEVNITSCNDLVPTRQQAVALSSADQNSWCHMVSRLVTQLFIFWRRITMEKD